MTIDDLYLWLEALASCAIEGNKFALETLKLWEDGKVSEVVERLMLLND